MASLPEQVYTAKFSDKDYYVKISLYNSEGDVVHLRKNALRHLEITDNIFNPFHCGSIIIANDFFILERAPTPYTVLGNGRDFIELSIIPIITGNFDHDISSKEVREIVGLNFLFIITETTDLMYNTSLCRRFKFVEFGQYLLNESYFNLFDISKGGDPTLPNALACDTTGNIIKKMLHKVFGESDDIFSKSTDGKIIFDENSFVDANIKPYDRLPWSDLLNYLMNIHTDQVGSPCVLNYTRGTKKFELRSLANIFQSHADPDMMIETLFFPSSQEFSSVKNNIVYNHCKAVFKESIINEFYTEPPPASYAVDLLASEHILSFSRQYNTFIYDTNALSKENFITTYFNLFCKPFAELFKSYSMYPNFYLNKNKDNIKSTVMPNPSKISERILNNQKLKSLLFMGYIYKFKLNGLTNRQSTKFVDVMRSDTLNNMEQQPTSFDKNTLGRHLITNVRHIFTQDRYTNEVETIKPYRLAKQDSNGIDSLATFLTGLKNI